MTPVKKLLLLFLLVPTLTSAEVLLTEDFEYPVGDDLVSHGWLTTYGAATSGITVTNGLAYNGYAGSNVGGAAVIDCKTSSDQPHLNFGEQTEGKIYTAFLFQPTIVDKSGYFFCLRDNIIMSTFNFYARVFISADYRLGLTFADNQRVQYAGPALDAQQVYLLVLEYAILQMRYFIEMDGLSQTSTDKGLEERMRIDDGRGVLGMELCTYVPLLLRNLYDLYEVSIRIDTYCFHAIFLEFIDIIVIKFVTMAVALLDMCAAVCLSRTRAVLQVAGIST